MYNKIYSTFKYERKIFINKLDFTYKLHNDFSTDIIDHHFTLKCVPCNNQRQMVESVGIKINSEENFTTHYDSFGNIVLSGSIFSAHNKFDVEVTGTAITDMEIFEDTGEDEVQNGIFKYQTKLTMPYECINNYSESLNVDLENNYNTALDIMRRLHKDMKYKKGSTDVSTTAEYALKNRCGVCQDYSHIMLSLLRLRNIPTRYCVGMISGEGETHAWVEVLSNKRWYGFDPTNNLLVDKNYIKISSGRDATDCSVNKGIFKGSALQQQTISVLVTQHTT